MSHYNSHSPDPLGTRLLPGQVTVLGDGESLPQPAAGGGDLGGQMSMPPVGQGPLMVSGFGGQSGYGNHFGNGGGGGGYQNEGGDPPVLDVGDIFRTLKKRWKLISLVFLSFVGLGVAYQKMAKKMYAATSSLEVLQEKVQVINGAFGTNDFRSLEILKTFEEKLTTQNMLQRIVQLNGLDKDPTFYPPPKTGEIKADELLYALNRRVTAELDRGTRLINITVKDTDPKRAVRLAKSFADEAKNLSHEESVATAQQAKQQLDAEVARSQASMMEAERAANAFRAANPGLALPEKQSDMKTTEAEDTQKGLTTHIAENRQKLIKLTSICEKIQQVGNSGLEYLVNISEIAALPEVNTLLASLDARQASFASIEAVYKHKHPKYIEAKQGLEELRTRLRMAADNAANGFQNSLDAARAEELQLKEAVSKAKAAGLIDQGILDGWEPLRRQMLARRDYYEQVLRRLQEAEVATTTNGGLISIVDYPVVPSSAIWPDAKFVLGGAGFLGLSCGLVLALLLKAMDMTIRNLSEGEKALQLPGLAAIPVESEGNPRMRLVSSANAPGESREAFRALRTSLSLLGKGLHAKTFLFTSANAAEGKSYCALNHAITLAQQGYRTLVVDADLRKPSLDELLLGHRNVAGLASHLRGQSEVNGSKPCNPTRIPNLFLFSAGITETEHPAELLSSQAFQQLLQEASKWFHRIVIDTPPINAVTDALLMAREVDSVAFVLKAGKTKREDAQNALRKLVMAGSKPVGFVLNHAPAEALVQGYVGDFGSLASPPGRRLALNSG